MAKRKDFDIEIREELSRTVTVKQSQKVLKHGSDRRNYIPHSRL